MSHIKVKGFALDALRAGSPLEVAAADVIENQRQTIRELNASLMASERQVRDQARELKRIRDNMRAAKK